MSSIASHMFVATAAAAAAEGGPGVAGAPTIMTATSSLDATTYATATTTTTTMAETIKIAPRTLLATATAAAAAGAATRIPTRTTITSDPGILCFHHCNVKVFCFTLPHICPNCKTKLDTTGDDADNDGDGSVGIGDETKNASNGVTTTKVLLPFRLPYPFVRASQYPCAILLRPTTGDFLNDYNNATDLHIAVTTSTGTVVEFDRHGLRHHRAENMPEWWQCLLVGDVPEPWYDYWDDILLQICKKSARWSMGAYDEDSYNCYTFVLAFLQALSYDKLSEAAQSKTSFCEKYIVPRTTTAGKYISLYRKLRDTGGGVYVHPYVAKQNRSKIRGYIKSSALMATTANTNSTIIPTATATINNAKRTPKATNSTASSIMLRTPKLCTIEE